LNRVACVINDKSRAAGRSGVGAVMGSKNLKAIAVRGTGAIQCADPLKFGELVFEAMKEINASPTTASALRGLGTASTVGFTNSIGILPTNNFQVGQFEHANAMELAQRGYIPEEDLADFGTELKFGNAEAVMRCLEMMSYRTGKFGDLLAEGGYRLAEHYGHPELFMGSKKQDFAAYDARGA